MYQTTCIKCGSDCEEIATGVFRCVRESCRFQYELVNVDKPIRHKSFKEQLRECKISGNLLDEYCVGWLHMCKKHGGLCISSKCKAERIDAK